MSGFPSEASLRTQWTNTVDVLEKHRVYADATAAENGELDTLENSLDGTFTAPGIQSFTSFVRSSLSALLDPSVAADALTPILFEFSRIIDSASNPEDQFGAGYEDISGRLRALYDYHANGSITVESRALNISNSTASGNGTGGSIVGNGAMTRLTKDERNYDMEGITVETKRFRCRQDQNSGVLENAEVFEMLGQEAGVDSLLRMDSATTPTYGSGTESNILIRNKHAGTGAGGSLLRNASFTTFDSSATPKFVGWDLTGTASKLTQDTSNTYIGSPGTSSSDDASMKLTADSSNTLTLTQTLTNLKVSRLDPNTPYFLRVMWNRSIGSGANGTVKLRLGAKEVEVTVASQSGWQELFIPADTNTWYRNFNQTSFNIDIEWVNSSSTGYILFDDAILVPYDLIDGSYWVLRHNAGTPVSWLIDDTLTFTDTGGLPSTAKIQYWWWVAFGTYLPSTTGTPTITEP